MSTFFDAIVTEDIPANRLLSMTGGNGAPHISITAAGGSPDFVSTGNLKESQTVVVTMKNKPIWTVEAGEELSAGQHVEVGDGGVLVASEGDGIGYVTGAVKAGELAEFVRQEIAGSGERGPQGPKGDKGDTGAKGAKGDPGKDGFPTEEQWNELVGRVEALEG